MTSKVKGSIENGPGFLMRRVHGGMQTQFNKLLANYDVTTRQYLVMRVIYEDKGNTVQSIAHFCGIDLGAVTRLVSRLMDKNLVKKSPSKKDQRVTYLSLSSKGKRLMPKLIELSTVLREEYLGVLSDSEYKTFTQLLHKVLNHLKTLEEGP